MTLQEQIDALRDERKSGSIDIHEAEVRAMSLLQDCQQEIERLQQQLDSEVAERSRLRGEQQALLRQAAAQTAELKRYRSALMVISEWSHLSVSDLRSVLYDVQVFAFDQIASRTPTEEEQGE